jgi:xylulokinase
VENPEGGAAGAAILAGVGVGIYEDFADAAKRAIRVGGVVRPRKATSAIYEACYRRYRAAYPAIKDLFPRG